MTTYFKASFAINHKVLLLCLSAYLLCAGAQAIGKEKLRQKVFYNLRVDADSNPDAFCVKNGFDHSTTAKLLQSRQTSATSITKYTFNSSKDEVIIKSTAGHVYYYQIKCTSLTNNKQRIITSLKKKFAKNKTRQKNYIPEVREYLSKGGTAKDLPLGKTSPLICAIRHGELQSLKDFIKEGFSITKTEKISVSEIDSLGASYFTAYSSSYRNYLSPLAFAILNNNIEAMKILLASKGHSINLNEKIFSNRTPLGMVSLKLNNISALKVLLEHGVDIEQIRATPIEGGKDLIVSLDKIIETMKEAPTELSLVSYP